MLELEDKIKQLKRDLQSYTYYQAVVNDCNEKLEEINNALIGVGSPCMKDVIIENGRNPYRDNRMELWFEEEKLMNKRKDFMNRIVTIDNQLSILSAAERNLVESIYKYGVSYDEAMKGKYRSRSTFFEDIKKILSKVVV